MSQAYTIRKIRLCEADKFMAVRRHALETDPDAFLATLYEEHQLTEDDLKNYLVKHYVLGAFTPDQKLVGTLAYMEQGWQKFKHIGILGGMYVDPSHRGRGIGRKLLTVMKKNLENLGHLSSLQLKVVTDNIPAIRLYESEGFSVWATEKNALCDKGRFFDQHHMAFHFSSQAETG